MENLNEILFKLENSRGRQSDKVCEGLIDYLEQFKKDLDDDLLKEDVIFSELSRIVRVLSSRTGYIYAYTLELALGCLESFYKRNKEYASEIYKLLSSSYNDDLIGIKAFYRLIEKTIDKDNANKILSKAKKYNNLHLLKLAHEALGLSAKEKIDDVNKIGNRRLYDDYLLKLNYEDNNIDYIKSIMDKSKSGSNYDKAAFYYYMLKGDEATALDYIRRACDDSHSSSLYFDYITVASTKEVELNWYFNHKSYYLLVNIFRDLEDYDSLMKVIIESKNFGLYEANYSLLGRKYPREYISTFLRYLPKAIKNLNSTRSYERALYIIRLIINLKPNREERIKLLEIIENSNDLSLKGEINKEIEYLKEIDNSNSRYK